MLLFIREKTAGIFAKAILGLFIILFAVIGLGDYNLFQKNPQESIATVGEFSLPRNEFEIVYRQYLQRFQTMMNNQFPVEMYRQDMINEALRALVTQKLFQNMFNEWKFDLAEPVVMQAIATNPAFADEKGVFQPSKFLAVLSRLKMSESQYTELLKYDLIASSVRDVVLTGYELPEFYLKRLYNYEFEQRNVTLASIPLKVFEKVEPTEEELQKFYTENLNLYQTPEFRTIQYIHLDPKALAQPIAITEDDIKAYYEQFLDRYTIPEKRQIEQLLADSQELADKARAALDEGVAFDTVAKILNNPGISYSDLGLLPKERLVKGLQDVAFSLEKGNITPVLPSSLGFHILKISHVEPEVITPLADVRAEIEDTLRFERAYTLMAEQLATIEELMAGGLDLSSIAAQTGVSLKTLPPVNKEGMTKSGHEIDVLKGQPDLMKSIFQQPVNVVSTPIDLEAEGVILYQVSAIEATQAKPFADVREDVVAAVKTAQAEAIARQKATDVVAKMNQGARMAEALQDFPEATLTEHTDLQRDGTTTDGKSAGINSFILDKAFTLPVKNALFHIQDDKVYLVLVTAINAPSKIDDTQMQSLTADMNAQLQQDIAEQFSAFLKRRYPVEIYADKLQNMFPEPVTVPDL